MNKIIFTEEFCQPENLYPFTLTRQLQDIRVGILTIREKWERSAKQECLSKLILFGEQSLRKALIQCVTH